MLQEDVDVAYRVAALAKYLKSDEIYRLSGGQTLSIDAAWRDATLIVNASRAIAAGQKIASDTMDRAEKAYADE